MATAVQRIPRRAGRGDGLIGGSLAQLDDAFGAMVPIFSRSPSIPACAMMFCRREACQLPIMETIAAQRHYCREWGCLEILTYSNAIFWSMNIRRLNWDAPLSPKRIGDFLTNKQLWVECDSTTFHEHAKMLVSLNSLVIAIIFS